jgi:hypothetical protein
VAFKNMHSAVARIKQFGPAWVLFLCVVTFAAAGCASKGSGYITRAGPTSIGPDERIAIVLSDYHESGETLSVSAALEESLGRCVKKGMRKVDKGLKFVSPDDCRKSVYPARAFADSPRSTEALLESLKDAKTASCYHELGVRYLVSMSADISKTGIEESHQHAGVCGAGSKGGGCLGAAEASWYKKYTSAFYGSLIDVNDASVAGRVVAADNSKTGGGLVVFFIVPLPYAEVAAPGTVACLELGRGLAQLILNQENKENMEPKTPKTNWRTRQTQP